MTTNDGINTEAAIRNLIDRFAEAFRARNVDRVMSLVCQGHRVVRHRPPLQTVDAESFVTHWQQFFESHEGPIHVEFRDLRIGTSDDVAFSYCVPPHKGYVEDWSAH